jgi:ketosteroid isomerase-like protein
MSSVPVSVVDDFLDAIVCRDLSRVQSLIAQDIDFRAMTPSRIWEAERPADVREVLRTWFEHPERDIEGVETIETSSVADTLRVGWRVRGQGSDGPFLYEQQAYVREQNGRIVWLRIMCSGPRPIGLDS